MTLLDFARGEAILIEIKREKYLKEILGDFFKNN